MFLSTCFCYSSLSSMLSQLENYQFAYFLKPAESYDILIKVSTHDAAVSSIIL